MLSMLPIIPASTSEADTGVLCPSEAVDDIWGLVWAVQVLESASRTPLFSDADEDALEAVSLFIKGMDETCSSECSINQHQV